MKTIRQMKAIRHSEEFKQAVITLYYKGMSCTKIAKKLAEKFDTCISSDFVAKLLKKNNYEVKCNNKRTVSIYDYQLGLLDDEPTENTSV